MNRLQIILILSLIRMTISPDLHSNQNFLNVETLENSNEKLHHDDFIKLTQQHGYGVEQHIVTTEDGYILKIFRIPTSSLFSNANGKSVVLLQHGLIASSDIWVFFNRSLAYELANAGYDVWIGNCRGNSYGRLHKNLSPEEPLFWNFSWHEIGKIDYAATIDYILNKTNKSNITFLGFSMGGTALMVLLSERPEYNKKLNLIITLAPSVFWNKQLPIRSAFFNVIHRLKDIFDPDGMSELLPQGALSIRLINNICRENLLDFCVFCFGLLSGHDRKLYNKEELLFLIDYFPAGSSTKCFWHFCQLVKNGEFRKYDYGYENFKYYGQNDPPVYNLSNVATNMVIFYAKKDPFSTKEDIDELSKRVSTNVMIKSVNYPKFSHFDFIIAKDVKQMIYNRIIKVISKYN